MRNIICVLLAFCTVTVSAQYKIKSIDYNTPFYQGGSPGNPFGLGVTLQDDAKKKQLFTRISGFNYGGYIQSSYYDSNSGYYTHEDKVIYRLPQGDSVLTKEYIERNSGIGIQIGLRRDFELWTLPFYTSAHIGLFAQRYDYSLAYSHTINSPDTSEYWGHFGRDYTSGSVISIYEDKGWTTLPQVGLETGLILSAGKRLQFIPKLALNLSLIRANGIQSPTDQSVSATITPTYNLQLDGSAALQISYLFVQRANQ